MRLTIFYRLGRALRVGFFEFFVIKRVFTTEGAETAEMKKYFFNKGSYLYWLKECDFNNYIYIVNEKSVLSITAILSGFKTRISDFSRIVKPCFRLLKVQFIFS